MKELLLLLLGWLLGLVSPAIVEEIRRRRETVGVREALRNELHELQYRLGLAAYFLHMRFGNVDRSLLEWVKQLAENYRGSNPKDAVIRSVEMQLNLSDEGIATVAAADKSGNDGGLSVKKYAIPLLDARMPAFWQLPREVQSDLLDIRARLDLYNEEVEHAQYYFQLTFNELGSENRKRVEQNLVGCYKNLARMGKLIADKIGSIEV